MVYFEKSPVGKVRSGPAAALPDGLDPEAAEEDIMLLPAADEDEVSAGLELDELDELDDELDELDELDALLLLLLEHPVRASAVASAADRNVHRLFKAAIASPRFQTATVRLSCGKYASVA